MFGQDGDEVVLRRTIGLKKDEFFLNRKRVTKQEVCILFACVVLTGRCVVLFRICVHHASQSTVESTSISIGKARSRGGAGT